jgi:pimeloyl-ACP methyl ester carboxylesterase
MASPTNRGATGIATIELTRRRLLQVMGGIVSSSSAAVIAGAQPAATQQLHAVPYTPGILPAGIRSRFVNNVNGLRVHVLEAGFEARNQPAVVLLHGFPELAYSWRKLMLPIAAAGYHVIAPDLRGYGRTTGWDGAYDGDLGSFGLLNYVRDTVGLVSAFGYRSVTALVGHDFGSPVAAWCALVRPDVFRSLVLMSAPFAGPPTLPFNTAEAVPTDAAATADRLDEELAALKPPRKQYRKYYSTRQANDDMTNAPQGLHAFLRAYYHMKSADWTRNAPLSLKAMTADELAKLPTYYIMELTKTMPETVAPEMPSPAEIAACKWLRDDELRLYTTEYQRTGFQGGLHGYRVRLTDKHNAQLQTFSGRTIDVPSMFVAGKSDWGVFQTAGAFESMQKTACTRMGGVHLVEGAGHWVQQEQADVVGKLLLQFLGSQPR